MFKNLSSAFYSHHSILTTSCREAVIPQKGNASKSHVNFSKEILYHTSCPEDDKVGNIG